ncbi:restriction endonuclease subunit S [Enterocloster clostridioformis]|uniref:restriction endonuclease subunit S n=1 Tax=Enterocloster clostridioformis TaxID=1531 RepID=UPI0007406958|nr:restriction endonuclease subunit S [Enterocloster clostridioformis]CUX74449.1 Putative type-1 restriction enzyme specificity protein MG438 [Clostridium sp. C105KSO14]
MTSMTKHTLVDCFSLRARIGWQGLRSDEFKTEGPYLVTGVDFHNGRVDWDDCYHVTEERYAQDKGIQLHEHDLLITKDGTIGKTAVVIDCPEKATLNSGVFVVRAINNEVVPEFLHYILHSHWFDLFVRNVLTGSTIKHLNQEKFYKFSFEAPDVPTQQKIVEVLESIDAVIDKTREFITKYTNIKSGMLHDLFETHLEGQKTRPLGEISNIQRGGSPRPIQDFITDSEDGINWIKIGDTSLTSKYIMSAKEKIIPAGVRHSRKVKPGDFVLSNSMSFGRPYIVGIDGCVHDGWLVISDYEDSLDVNYLYYILCSHQVQKQLEALAAGSTVQNLKSDTVKKVVIPVPDDIDEQKRLAEMISSVDEKLDNERTYLAKLEDTKRGLIRDLLEEGYDISPLM